MSEHLVSLAWISAGIGRVHFQCSCSQHWYLDASAGKQMVVCPCDSPAAVCFEYTVFTVDSEAEFKEEAARLEAMGWVQHRQIDPKAWVFRLARGARVTSGFVGDEGYAAARLVRNYRSLLNDKYTGGWLDKTWHPDGCRCMGGRCRMYVSDR